MTTAVQHRRGTTAEHSTFTGLEGEVTIDTTKDTAVIHDGVLAGGYPLAKENLANVNPSGLSSIDGASTASDDKFFIYDQSATTLKTITRAELNNAMEQDALANVAITGGTINGTTIGGTTAAGGSFTTLSASSSVTLSGGTANGVPYLNGSKVLTTGSALTFDGTNLSVGTTSFVSRFNVEGNVSLLGGNKLFLWNTANTAAPYIRNVGGSDLGFFDTSDGERMRLTSTGLGIGTSSPGARLHVVGGDILAGLSDGTSNGVVAVAASGGQKGNISASAGSFDVRAYFNNPLIFYTGLSAGTERMRLDASGNLGLGVTPSAWRASDRAIQVGRRMSLYADSQVATEVGNNTFMNASSSRTYIESGFATRYEQWQGEHRFFTAPSGTAGAAISFTQAMTLTAAGNLGLGTTSPASLSGYITHTLDGASGSFSEYRQNNGNNFRVGSDSSAGGFVFTSVSAPIRFGTNGIERARIDSSGRWLLGTTTGVGNDFASIRFNSSSSFPQGLNMVDANASANGTVFQVFRRSDDTYLGNVRRNSTDNALYVGGNSYLALGTGDTERARIDSSGRLLVGTTTSGSFKLDVQDAGNTLARIGGSGTGQAGLTLASGGAFNPFFNFLSSGSTVEASIFAVAGSGALVFGTGSAGTERARIDSSGNLLVGVTSALNGIATNGSGLSVSSGSNGALVSANSSNSNLYIGKVSGYTNGAYIDFYVNGSRVGVISTNGTSTTYATSSDYRLKENIQPMTGALAKVAALKPCTYKWKADGSDGEGFIAHELAEVVPQAVTGEKDAVDENGNPKYQGIDTSFLVATLTAAIQELKAEFDAYKATHH